MRRAIMVIVETGNESHRVLHSNKEAKNRIKACEQAAKVTGEVDHEPCKHLYLCAADYKNVGFQLRLNIRLLPWLKFGLVWTIQRKLWKECCANSATRRYLNSANRSRYNI